MKIRKILCFLLSSALLMVVASGCTAKKDSGPTSEYPTGFRYERFALPSARQIAWENDGMYYIQFQNSDLLKMKNYVPNQSW